MDDHTEERAQETTDVLGRSGVSYATNICALAQTLLCLLCLYLRLLDLNLFVKLEPGLDFTIKDLRVNPNN